MPLISPLPSYLALSDDPLKRREIYRSFVEMKTDQEMEKKIFAGKLKSKSRRYERLFQQTYGELELMTRK
ncbi:MAG: hypothetical protein Q7T11_05330 [Deltaproteobacteria bacterium]|nr:hypothetical protein [Deltaproteobacteria bacterium]